MTLGEAANQSSLHTQQTPCVGRSLHILLTEDNAVNQMLARRLLEKRGYQVTVAGTGREALAAIEQRQFDLVLMDIQMPEMDGLEATAAIRRKEQKTGAHLPIIALTAHALKSDQEQCYAAGMDGHVSKPIQPQVLFTTIENIIGTSSRVEANGAADAKAATVFDQAEALARLDGDAELLRELMALFLSDCPRLLAEIRQAVLRRDGEMLQRAAHTLKGAVSSFSAEATCAAALKLETMGRAGDFGQVEAACEALEMEIKRLRPVLAAFGLEQEPCVSRSPRE
jgi:CheY-like chemotaxis protein